MNRRMIIGIGVVCLVVGTPFLTTWFEEWRLYSRDRIAAEIGYSIPQDSEITTTSARIWSLVDGANYSWSITSARTLLPWVQSIGKLEFGQTYRVNKRLLDGREETSYITLALDERTATVETFRP